MKMGVVDAKADAVAILKAYRAKFADQDTMINSLFVQLDTELDKLVIRRGPGRIRTTLFWSRSICSRAFVVSCLLSCRPSRRF